MAPEFGLEELRVLADRMEQGAVAVSAEGKVLCANQRFAAMAGQSAASLQGVALAELAADADRARFAQDLPRAGRRAVECQILLAPRHGHQLPVHAVGVPLGDGRSLWLVSDISLQRRHQATDERTSKFLGTLAHEFRGMLATIGYSVAYLRAGTTLEPKAREALDTIERQTQRLSALVEDLRSVNPKD
ncbi:MAG: histidine kinase dimerization/phospho-acceptor domain-containing protein [Betaproteobacteria bacterium]